MRAQVRCYYPRCQVQTTYLREGQALAIGLLLGSLALLIFAFVTLMTIK